MRTAYSHDELASGAEPAARVVHMEQLIRILSDQTETCRQIAECALEQQESLRQGKGSDFVRASLTQAHLARRLFFLEEERTTAVQALAQSLLENSGEMELTTLMDRLPESDSVRLAARTRDLQEVAVKASSVQRVNAQLVQTNLQLAAALTRNVIDPSTHYSPQPTTDALPASKLDQRI